MSQLAVVIADTHIPRRAKALPEDLGPYLERADLVLHAGDLMDPALLEELAAYAPVEAVRGNMAPEGLPETRGFEFGGGRVSMVHESGPEKGRRGRLRATFREARVVLFGPSPLPLLGAPGGLHQ